ncbi:MAG TPA: PIN domain-containing protein [Tepidisphaeraceae bacterium]|jgi:predicted nucleic acid-binding protein|nr:PIN domain-containing protein [Tepidisphaeraceae bacterium]
MSDVVFFDTNVLLDVLLARKPFVRDAQRLWSLAEEGQIQAVVSAVSFLNVYYVVRRLASRREADRAVRGMQAVFQVAPVTREVIDQAIEADAADFEDAVQHACAVRAAALCIVTRDGRHFARSALPILAPDAFLANLGSE